MKLYLTGFMGSGKSLIGKKLAEKLQFKFLDLDTAIEEYAGKSVAEIFVEKGEAAFREMEQKMVRQTDKLQNTIIATGGGTPCFYENMDWMNKHGLTIFLEVSPEILAQRLKGEKQKRPLLAGKNESAAD